MKKILIIGAGFLQAFVIQKAKDMGYYTLAVDADKNAIGFRYVDKYAVLDIIDEQACLDFARSEKINGVLTAATDYGVLTTSYIARELNLPGLDYDVARLVKNKYLTRKCLFEHSVDDTEQTFEVDGNTDIKELAEIIKYPVMVKPCDGSGSRGTSKVDGEQDLYAACKLAQSMSVSKRAEIESFIRGKEYGAESLVVDGEPHVLAIMQKWMTEPPYYAELGHAIPSGLSEDIERKAKECVHKAIKALGINFGSVNMDLLITKEGKVHIVDIGARMGGNLIGSHIISAGTGIDYMAAMIQNAMGEQVNLTAEEHGVVATKLLAFHQGVVRGLPDFNGLEQRYHVKIYHHMKKDEHIHEYHTNLDGYGYILAGSDDIDDAIERTDAVKKAIAECIY